MATSRHPTKSMQADFADRVAQASSALSQKITSTPRIGIIVGTGLSPVVDSISEITRVAYPELPRFPVSTAPGHKGEWLSGALHAHSVLVMNGRFHLYEGYTPDDVVMPIYVMRSVGVEHLIITNAAGSLNPDFAPGDAMLITDQINLLGANPLTGMNHDHLGVRFPDMSDAYASSWRERTLAIAKEHRISLRQGVYCATPGPSLETSAERRFMRMIGGDAVGMSTALETIAANHAGLQVLGLSAICNVATGDKDQQADDIDSVIHYAGIAGARIGQLLDKVIQTL